MNAKTIVLVHRVHRYAEHNKVNIGTACQEFGLSAHLYKKYMDQLYSIRDNEGLKRLDPSLQLRVVKAAHIARRVDFNKLPAEKPELRRMRFCPRTRGIIKDNLGCRKGVITKMGQIVFIKPIGGRSQYCELFADLNGRMGEYCGVAHKEDLLPIRITNDELKLRISNLKQKQPAVDKEVENLASVVKERNQRRTEIENALKRKEREEKLKNKKEKVGNNFGNISLETILGEDFS